MSPEPLHGALSNVTSKVMGGYRLPESARVGLQEKLYEHIEKMGKSQVPGSSSGSFRALTWSGVKSRFNKNVMPIAAYQK